MYTETHLKRLVKGRVCGAMANRILVVDDEPTVTEVVERYLVREGYEVASAADGADGLSLAREWAPNLIVLDLMLPSIDGLEVCR